MCFKRSLNFFCLVFHVILNSGNTKLKRYSDRPTHKLQGTYCSLALHISNEIAI